MITAYKKVTLNEKEYTLRFDFNSMVIVEEYFGKGVVGVLNEEQIGFRMLRGFYYAGLKWQIHGLTVDKVGKLLGHEIQVNGKSILDLMNPVMDLLQESKLLGIKKEENEDSVDLEISENVEEDQNPNA